MCGPRAFPCLIEAIVMAARDFTRCLSQSFDYAAHLIPLPEQEREGRRRRERKVNPLHGFSTTLRGVFASRSAANCRLSAVLRWGRNRQKPLWHKG